MNDSEGPGDAIGDAIESVEAKAADEPDHLIADFRFENGETMRIAVPIAFTADQFETAVATLIQLRVAADQRRAQRPDGLVLPEPPKLVGVDGGRL